MLKKEKIVIIGGGFAGAFAAKHLRRYAADRFDIELINSTNYFVFQPLLPEVVSGTISAPDAVTPLRYMLPGVRVRMAEVTNIDMQAQRVDLLQGTRRFPQSVDYDQLIIAVGQKTDLSLAPGLEAHALCVRDLADAHELRNRVIQCLENADVTQNPEVKQRLLTFVVAGGGFSGVEIMGEMLEMIHRTLRFYPNIAGSEIRTVLIQRGDRILPELSPGLGDYAEERLRARNVEFHLNSRITSATASAAYLDDGTRIPTDTLVVTAGSGPRRLATKIGGELRRGKIVVNKFLNVEGHENVWCIGDAASIPMESDDSEQNRYAPPTAQFAIREARAAAENIIAVSSGRRLERFAYRPIGSLASIGNYKAVAELYGWRLSGLFAWLTWRAVYIGMLPGFSTRLRVALNWLFDYFLPRSIVQIANRFVSETSCRHYASGDVICEPGQIIDGRYLVIAGALQWRVPPTDECGGAVRAIGVGGSWGEASIRPSKLSEGTLIATERAEVLVIHRPDLINVVPKSPRHTPQ